MKSNTISKTYLLNIGKFFAIAFAFVFLTLAVTTASAQSGDIDQCANGGVGNPPESCNEVNATNAANWVNGNLGASKSHYVEGDSIPYRIRFEGLTLGSHQVTIEWDTLQGGKHAIDYITTYNRTVSDADPCAGPANQFPTPIAGCGASTTFPIPADPLVTGAGVTPIAGNFTLYGGTITSVSTYGGPTGTDAARSITITFTASVSNPVLAWGGHIATRLDWGFDNSAVNISGSPYHMRFIGLDGKGGNQDRSLSAAAVVYPAIVTIIKQVQGFNGTTTSSTTFQFTATGTDTDQSEYASFGLVDQYIGNNPSNPAGTDTHFINLLGPFPSDGSVVETNPFGSGFFLDSITCNLTSGGGVLTGATFTSSAATRTVSWHLNEANFLTCTFLNKRLGTTAATASVSGRVTTSSGKGIRGAVVTATDNLTGKSLSATTDTKGNYTITNLEDGDFFNISAAATGYTFTPNSQNNVLVSGDVTGINFVASGTATHK